jgi:hypothetical protein
MALRAQFVPRGRRGCSHASRGVRWKRECHARDRPAAGRNRNHRGPIPEAGPGDAGRGGAGGDWPVWDIASTDADGFFRFEGVPVGTYRLGDIGSGDRGVCVRPA